MLGVIVDPTAVVLALIITGLEEALMRCTIVHRDNFMRWLLGKKEATLEEQEMEREIWALSSAISMYHELVSWHRCRGLKLFNKEDSATNDQS